MEIQKEREAFELNVNPVTWERIEYNAENNIYMAKSKYWTSTIVQAVANEIDFGWKMWQLAKAQVVPEGFKVVSFKQISELVVAVNKVDLMTHTEQKTNEARLAWQDIASKLQTMIEAQEQKG